MVQMAIIAALLPELGLNRIVMPDVFAFDDWMCRDSPASEADQTVPSLSLYHPKPFSFFQLTKLLCYVLCDHVRETGAPAYMYCKSARGSVSAPQQQPLAEHAGTKLVRTVEGYCRPHLLHAARDHYIHPKTRLCRVAAMS